MGLNLLTNERLLFKILYTDVSVFEVAYVINAKIKIKNCYKITFMVVYVSPDTTTP